MIRMTFQMIPAVGAKKERGFWEGGILDWDDFLHRESIPGMKDDRKTVADACIQEADGMLRDNNFQSLACLLPRSEQWRLYRAAKGKALFLDIETDGLSRNAEVTVVGMHGPGWTDILVKDRGLSADRIQRRIDEADILVTFNGSCFDVPVLRQRFPGLRFDLPHFDLRFGCKRAGMSGGLKNVEVMMGLRRDEDLHDVDGAEAVRLWKAWRRHNDTDALDKLERYNRADTENLEQLADMAYPMIKSSTLGGII